jgi:glycosyltransferase involved in cell wall biosynthesis
MQGTLKRIFYGHHYKNAAKIPLCNRRMEFFLIFYSKFLHLFLRKIYVFFMRVLILANDCNPDWPSLPVVGYNYAKAIADYVEVVVATQIRNKSNIEREGFGNAKVVYLDTENIASPLYKIAKFLRGNNNKAWSLQMAMNYPSYLAFEWAVWRLFREEIQEKHFDIIHRITPMSPSLPSLISYFTEVPFVIGPLNGNLNWPQQFLAEQVREREILRSLRAAYKFLPFYRSTYNRAACILSAFSHTTKDLPSSVQDKVISFPEVGIDPERFQKIEYEIGPQITILFVGRLVPYKLAEVLVEAFAESSLLQRHKLVIVGDGPERPRLESMVEEKGIKHCVKILGQKTQAEVGQLMQKSQIFAFPSIRELGAGVVIEAMASGMACVVVDYGAPGELIDHDRGIKIPLGSRPFIIEELRSSLEGLVSEPEKIKLLGLNAQAYAMAYFVWQKKAKKTFEIYSWIKDSSLIKPGFWDSDTK